MQLDWKRLRYLPLAFLCFCGVTVVDYAIWGKEAKEKQVALEMKFQLISDPKFARLVASGAGFKTSGGYATRALETEQSDEDVEAYYREELERHEWFYVKEDYVWTGRRVLFCGNDEDTVAIELPDRDSRDHHSYRITATWNNSNGCR